MVGHYYQHASPFTHDWKVKTARAAMYRAAQVERRVKGDVGWLAPNIGVVCRPA
jgi:hypothetical protein